jgi:rare lipoprotein A
LRRSFIISAALILALGPGVLFSPAPSLAEIATWYGAENGSGTASGERFNPEGFCADYSQHSCTCAHRTYPFGTSLRVRWRGRSVVCRVTGADIDLSKSGARVLGMIETGRAHVSIERMGRME